MRLISTSGFNFEEYGFEVSVSELGAALIYGPEDIDEEFVRRNTVLFSMLSQQADQIELAVTPTLLDMPIDPPFLFAMSNRREIRNLLDSHRATADQLQFPHQRIAQYLALRYLNRKTGEKLDRHDIVFLTNTDFSYIQKIHVLHAA